MINYEDAIIDKSQPWTETEKIQIKPTKNKVKLIDEKSHLLIYEALEEAEIIVEFFSEEVYSNLIFINFDLIKSFIIYFN